MIEDYYWYWICNIPGVGRIRINRLLKEFGAPMNVYKAEEKELRRVNGITDSVVDNILNEKNSDLLYNDFMSLKERGISFTYPGKSDYPARLLNIYDYPFSLYYKGSLPSDNIMSVAIVGSRTCSDYGRSMAYYLGKEFARMGIQVISGLAAGTDAAGHEGCLCGNGKTYGVLGCGVDICYPRQNIDLYSRMEKQGGIISEYAVGTQPYAGQFPVRNRIISGLSDVVIVVEARKKSGSLITVDQALEQNREIMVVPGRLSDKLSEGCNELIKMGAAIITKPEDILDCFCAGKYKDNLRIISDKNVSDISTEVDEEFKNKKNILATPKDMLYSCLDLTPMSLNDILAKTGMPMREVCSLLMELELDGLVREIAKNSYVKVLLQKESL